MTRSLLIRRFSVFHPPRSICASHSVQFRCLACAAAVTGLLLRTPTGRATGNSSRVSRATAPRKNLLAHFRCLTAHSSPLSYLIPSHFLLISSHLLCLFISPLSSLVPSRFLLISSHFISHVTSSYPSPLSAVIAPLLSQLNWRRAAAGLSQAAHLSSTLARARRTAKGLHR